MGLDARDCRLDIAFVLCDANIPDDVDWDWSLRDKSGVWLDFIDEQFDPTKQDVYDTCSDSTEENTTLIPTNAHTEVLASAVSTLMTIPSVSVKAKNSSITVTNKPTSINIKAKPSSVSTKVLPTMTTARPSGTTVSGIVTTNSISVKPKKEEV